MKILRKHIDCGKYSFDVAIDRDIALRAMEAFPDLCDYMFTKAQEEIKKPKGDDEKRDGNMNDLQFFLKSIREKEAHKLYAYDEDFKEYIKYAFPLMLKKAGSDLDAKEVIDYIYENGVSDEFNTAIHEFIMLGFTQGEVTTQKKVNFSMK